MIDWPIDFFKTAHLDTDTGTLFKADPDKEEKDKNRFRAKVSKRAKKKIARGEADDMEDATRYAQEEEIDSYKKSGSIDIDLLKDFPVGHKSDKTGKIKQASGKWRYPKNQSNSEMSDKIKQEARLRKIFRVHAKFLGLKIKVDTKHNIVIVTGKSGIPKRFNKISKVKTFIEEESVRQHEAKKLAKPEGRSIQMNMLREPTMTKVSDTKWVINTMQKGVPNIIADTREEANLHFEVFKRRWDREVKDKKIKEAQEAQEVKDAARRSSFKGRWKT